MTPKQCLKCKDHKPRSSFSKDLSRKDKLRPYCKTCCSLYGKQWRENNKDEITAYDKNYYVNNKAGYRRRQQTFRENSTEKYLVGLARRRAKRKGLEFSLTFRDITIPAVCPVLGIAIELHRGSAQDSSPSIDRTDNAKGYTPDNVLIISKRANELKRDASLSELQRLASFYTEYMST